MDNNIFFISSIEKYNDFEELVRRFVQKIYSSDAFITNGPYDGGKDLAYSIRGREVKQAIQVTITKNIANKLDEDLEKTLNLIDKHNYPPILIFFWNQTASESKLDTFKTNALKNFGITLEFYDANRIAQKITHDYPDLLSFLLEDIHKYKAVKSEALNIKEIAFYEYLALSKDAANLKNVIIDSYIVSLLSEDSKTEFQIQQETLKLEIHEQSVRYRLNLLKKEDRILFDGESYSLSDVESKRIRSIVLKENTRRSKAIELIQSRLASYIEIDIAEQVFSLIQKAYAESVNVQLNELNFESPKNKIVKEIIKQLEVLLYEKGHIDKLKTNALAGELVSIIGENEYLSDYCASRLCVNLLDQKKLEKYIENKYFYIYFDAPVLIPYLISLRYGSFKSADRSITTVQNLKGIVYSLKNKELKVTQEHLEETVRHLENAIKISLFANDQLVEKLGNSKNVFFNAYLQLKHNKSLSYNFDLFLDEFIGFEQMSESSSSRFMRLSRCVTHFLEINSIATVSTTEYHNDPLIDDIYKRYTRQSHKIKNSRTVHNDIHAALALSDETRHCDENGIGQTPILITWDGSQHDLRNVVRQKAKFKEWLVYTPQRAIERLSMIEMKISSSIIKDGVMALIDEDYFFKDNDSNLIDTLALLIKDEEADGGALPTLINRLSQRVTEESSDSQEIEKEHFNTLNEVLVYTYTSFKSNFSQIKTMFADEHKTDILIEILSETLKNSFNEQAKSIYKSKIEFLINI